MKHECGVRIVLVKNKRGTVRYTESEISRALIIIFQFIKRRHE